MSANSRQKRRQQETDGNEIILLDNVSKTYSTGAPALNGVTLSINKGEFVFIVGACENPAWKDTQVPQKSGYCISGFPVAEGS